ncbi:hypothetical protein [Leifsonia sp. LS1]|uniref:hypothetical protein n=1 Tax=Leifsonia sp. LS1 TaxID=2828483 RepID=UPI001CFE8D70|nr:hypothetical protein [Leifsonia sp. LS1]
MALTTTSSNECRKPVVPDAGIALCALHLLLAAREADAIGQDNLVQIVKTDAELTSKETRNA